MTLEEAAVSDRERSAALDGWVEAFDREMQEGDFAATIAAMTAHGCFDVRAVAERWILANPTGNAVVAQEHPVLREVPPLQPEPEEAPPAEEAAAPRVAALDPERESAMADDASAPDVAYFHSLLQGGIERAQIDEAFPGWRLVIDEAVSQYEAAAPILSDAAQGPTREDLDGEIRGIRQELQASRPRGRRRWRDRD